MDSLDQIVVSSTIESGDVKVLPGSRLIISGALHFVAVREDSTGGPYYFRLLRVNSDVFSDLWAKALENNDTIERLKNGKIIYKAYILQRDGSRGGYIGETCAASEAEAESIFQKLYPSESILISK
jgi:hypothetical protein